jgi:hypothetical protein
MDQDANFPERRRVDDAAPYSSRIIKAGALLSDTKTLLSHWDLAETVQSNLDLLRRASAHFYDDLVNFAGLRPAC